MTTSLDKLFEDLTRETAADSKPLPPVESWSPPLSGDIDIVITRAGDWIHEGDPIQRPPLIKLFSSILKREGDEYFLVTPVEKWRIQVEDVPFQVTGLEVANREGVQVLIFETSVGNKVIAGPEHPLRVAIGSEGEPSPYVMIRGGMEGLVARAVFYRLAELAVPGPEQEKAVHGVYSLGQFYPLE